MKIITKLIGFLVNIVSLFSKRTAGKIALYLFTTPRRGRINEKQSDFLGTAFREEIDYKDTSIMTYRWLGNRKTILLVHGWESNSARWQPLIDQLKKHHYSIIALDAPAHGRSGSKRFTAIQYAEFIQVVSKKFSPDIIIGHSAGGMASAIYQSKYSAHKKENLILLGTPSEFTDVLNRYFKMMSYNNRVIDGVYRLIKEQFNADPSEFSTAKLLKSMTSKGLIIHDKNDNIIPYSDALIINQSYKHSNLITTNGFGHSLNNNQVYKSIHEFIAS
ncbi:alpha/beta fold hydrolase [Hanstruepera marina]|uniref:alpha/beta fold hydrolase n=1 Tax=Hanstruepera marina TaxID=2873265 RepID=UPI001CA63A14|nr:alpha/beta hydrolase [Hanstruepera marina]